MEYATQVFTFGDNMHDAQRFTQVNAQSLAQEYFLYPPAEASPGASAPLHSYYGPPSESYYSQPEYPVYEQDHTNDVAQSLVYPTPTPSPETSLLIHAPVPVSAYSTLLPSIHESARSPTPQPLSHSIPMHATPTKSGVGQVVVPTTEEDVKPLYATICYASIPQQTFPTPCELLSELTAHDRACDVALGHRPRPLASQADHQLRDLAPMAAAAECTASLLRSDAEAPKVTRRARSHAPKKPETQRKAHFRAIAENIGFKPTDPDTITSHDKKRHYLECVEQYVLWLHEQIRLVGAEAVQFERVPDYRGLTSRSIRTLLVHMQNECRTLHHEVLNEEHTFMELQRQVMEHEQAAAGSPDNETSPTSPVVVAPHRRHSIASGMIPMCPASHVGEPAVDSSFRMPSNMLVDDFNGVMVHAR